MPAPSLTGRGAGLARFLIGAWLLAAFQYASAALPVEVAAALAAERIPASNAALWVQELGAPAPLVQHNETLPMNPASVIKLLTTYAGLELLGPAFTWKTEAWTAAPLAAGVLQGDLVLRGGADPRFTFENFWLMLRALRGRGVRDIRGDLVLDRSWLETGAYDPARFDGKPTQPYNARPDALLLNFNAFRFSFLPDAEHRAVDLLSEPPSSRLEVVNEVRYADGPCTDWRSQLTAQFRPSALGTRAVFSGTYPGACGDNTWNVAPIGHSEYLYGVFRKLWLDLGGTLDGLWREAPLPQGARLLYRYESPSLAEAVQGINKYSNNVMARQLFLDLSAELEGPPGRAERSAALVKSWLAEKGLAMPELVLENGSGLSRLERISAQSLGRLLAAAYASDVMPEFMSSLPVVAVDGTMRRRLRGESVSGHGHIKTGSLNGARSIAGYLLDRHGRRNVVVFMINHPNAAASQSAMDALLRWVYARP